jgi:hypothetical protein
MCLILGMILSRAKRGSPFFGVIFVRYFAATGEDWLGRVIGHLSLVIGKREDA